MKKLGMGTVVLLLGTTGCAAFINAMNQAAENNRTVVVTIVGAVVNPTNQEGRGWDALPGSLTPDEVAGVAVKLANAYYTGSTTLPMLDDVEHQIAGALTNNVLSAFDKPDPTGTVIVYEGAAHLSYDLPTAQETFTPRWFTRIPNVHIHQATISVDVRDADFGHQDEIGSVTLTSGELLQIESQSGGNPYILDVSGESLGMVHRLIVMVSGS